MATGTLTIADLLAARFQYLSPIGAGPPNGRVKTATPRDLAPAASRAGSPGRVGPKSTPKGRRPF